MPFVLRNIRILKLGFLIFFVLFAYKALAETTVDVTNSDVTSDENVPSADTQEDTVTVTKDILKELLSGDNGLKATYDPSTNEQGVIVVDMQKFESYVSSLPASSEWVNTDEIIKFTIGDSAFTIDVTNSTLSTDQYNAVRLYTYDSAASAVYVGYTFQLQGDSSARSVVTTYKTTTQSEMAKMTRGVDYVNYSCSGGVCTYYTNQIIVPKSSSSSGGEGSRDCYKGYTKKPKLIYPANTQVIYPPEDGISYDYILVNYDWEKSAKDQPWGYTCGCPNDKKIFYWKFRIIDPDYNFPETPVNSNWLKRLFFYSTLKSSPTNFEYLMPIPPEGTPYYKFYWNATPCNCFQCTVWQDWYAHNTFYIARKPFYTLTLQLYKLDKAKYTCEEQPWKSTGKSTFINDKKITVKVYNNDNRNQEFELTSKDLKKGAYTFKGIPTSVDNLLISITGNRANGTPYGVRCVDTQNGLSGQMFVTSIDDPKNGQTYIKYVNLGDLKPEAFPSWITALDGDVFSEDIGMSTPAAPANGFGSYLINHLSDGSGGYAFANNMITLAPVNVSKNGGFAGNLMHPDFTNQNKVQKSHNDISVEEFDFRAPNREYVKGIDSPEDFSSLENGGIYTISAETFNDMLSASSAPLTYSVADSGVAIVYVQDDQGELAFQRGFVPSNNGRLLIIADSNVTFTKNVGFSTISEYTPTATPLVVAGIVSSGDIIFESTADVSTELPILVQGPLVAKGTIQVPRNLGDNNGLYPAVSVLYSPRYLTKLTQIERSHDVQNYTGSSTFDVQFDYLD